MSLIFLTNFTLLVVSVPTATAEAISLVVTEPSSDDFLFLLVLFGDDDVNILIHLGVVGIILVVGNDCDFFGPPSAGVPVPSFIILFLLLPPPSAWLPPLLLIVLLRLSETFLRNRRWDRGDNLPSLLRLVLFCEDDEDDVVVGDGGIGGSDSMCSS